MSDPRVVERIEGPIDAVVDLPGSKSISNRALLAAALAEGRSTLVRLLSADDTAAMRDAMTVLGARVVHDVPASTATVDGIGGALPAGALTIDARQSGTTGRFLLPVLAAGEGPYLLTGDEQLLRRPLAGGIEAIEALGATVERHGGADRLPVTIHGARTAPGTVVRVGGAVSSQLISGLLLAGPLLPGGIQVVVEGPLISRPYVEMTLSVQQRFGIDARWLGGGRLVVPEGCYAATTLDIEPDATAASYFLAAAAVLGGRVRIAGLGSASVQGDAAFAAVLGQMGAEVSTGPDWTEVRGTGVLQGIDVDLADLSDTAPTLAVVAALAQGPTRIRGIGFIRGKESDRIGDVARELRRCGIGCDEEPDGLVVHPGTITPTEVQTYRDHRIAMSFAVLGLATGDIAIVDPGCVAKTFPGFFDVLDTLRPPARAE